MAGASSFFQVVSVIVNARVTPCKTLCHFYFVFVVKKRGA